MEEKVNLRSHVIKWGAIIGFMNVAFTLIMYILDYTLMAKMSIQYFIAAINIGLVIYSTFEYRKLSGGFIGFKSAFGSSLAVFVAEGIIKIAFFMLLMNVIDTELADKLQEASIEQTVSMMEGFGADETAIDTTIAAMEEQDSYSIKNSLIGFSVMTFVNLLLSLVIGLIVKKEEPVNF